MENLSSQFRGFLSGAQLGALDSRFEEQPEDLCVAAASSRDRGAVVCAVTQLLADSLTLQSTEPEQSQVAVLHGTIRLAEILEIEQAKPLLKVLALDEGETTPIDQAEATRALAARALLSLPLSNRDFAFWEQLAKRWETSLPYALRAALAIELDRGLVLFWTLFDPKAPARDHPLVDWGGILGELEERYELATIRRRLERAFYEVLGMKDAFAFEVIVRRWLRLPRMTRRAERSLHELDLRYTIPPIESTVRRPARDIRDVYTMDPGAVILLPLKTLDEYLSELRRPGAFGNAYAMGREESRQTI